MPLEYLNNHNFSQRKFGFSVTLFENMVFLPTENDNVQGILVAYESPCHASFRTGFVFTVAMPPKKYYAFQICILTFSPQLIGYPTTRPESEGFENVFTAS